MGRSGIYKSDVQKARDLLLAQGTHPSVDAVRIALGNTGSKTTISKYLKELHDEDGGGSRRASISETLQDLVERLARQLQQEADERIQSLTAQHQEQIRRQADEAAGLRAEVAALQSRLAETGASLEAEQTQHARLREQHQELSAAHRAAGERITGLEHRLTENEQHRQSLEQKHEHARQSLEHFRASAREQREQDQRRHEQQIQHLQAEIRTLQQTVAVRQEEVTRLNQEGARLVAELLHARDALHAEQEAARKLAQRVETLERVEHEVRVLEGKLATAASQVTRYEETLVDAVARGDGLSGRVHTLELELAGTHARLEAQVALNAELRSLFVRPEPQAEAAG